MAEVEKQEAEKPNVFLGDVVTLADEPETRGLVVKLGWEDEENFEPMPDEDEDPLAEGHVRIGVPGKPDSDVHHSKLTVVDRPFLHGDVVHAAGDDKRLGTVVEVELTLDASVQQVGGEKPQIVSNIQAREVPPIHPFQNGAHVVRDGQLGLVQQCNLDVTVRFADGGVCVLHEPTEDDLKNNDVGKPSALQAQLDPLEFYPGQKVKSTVQVWKKAKWIKGKYSMKRAGTVVAVSPSTVIVDWRVLRREDGDEPEPVVTEPQTLTPLDHFGYARWQVGDTFLLTESMKSKYGGVEVKEAKPAKKDELKIGKKATKKEKAADSEGEAASPAVVVNTVTRVDILWQDGTVQKGVSTVGLAPIMELLNPDVDIFPGDFVVDKGTNQVGYFIKREAENASVRFLKEIYREDDAMEGDDDEDGEGDAPKKLKEPKPEINEEDLQEETKDVALDSVKRHPEMDFHLGGVVVRIPDDDDNEEGDEGDEGDEDKPKKKKAPKEKKPAEKEYPDSQWAGTVVRIHDGKVTVTWSDGHTEDVLPETICQTDGRGGYFGDDDDEDGFPFDGDEMDDEEGDEDYVDEEEEEESARFATRGRKGGMMSGGMRAKWVDGDEDEEDEDEEEEAPKRKGAAAAKGKKGHGHSHGHDHHEDHHSHGHSHAGSHASHHGHSHAHGVHEVEHGHSHSHGGHGGHGGHGHSHGGHAHDHDDEEDHGHSHARPSAKPKAKAGKGKKGAAADDVEFSEEAKALLHQLQTMNLAEGAPAAKKGGKKKGAAAVESKFEWEDADVDEAPAPAAKKGGKKKAAAPPADIDEDEIAAKIAAAIHAAQAEPKSKPKKKAAAKEVVEETVNPKKEETKKTAPKKKAAEAAEPSSEAPAGEAKKKSKAKPAAEPTDAAPAPAAKKASKAKAAPAADADAQPPQTEPKEAKKKSKPKPAAAAGDDAAPAEPAAEPKKKTVKAKAPADESAPAAAEAKPKKAAAKKSDADVAPASAAPAEPKKKASKAAPKDAPADAAAPTEAKKADKPKAKPAAKKKSQVPEA